MLRNTDGQKRHVKAFNGTGFVSGIAESLTAELAIDDGPRVALNDVHPVEIGATGEYTYDLTRAETNGHKLSFTDAVAVGGVQVLGMPSNVIYTTDPSLMPVKDLDGNLNPIFIGDDYMLANGREIWFEVEPPDGTTVAGGSCSFGGSAGSDSSWRVTGTLSEAANGKFRTTFELPQAITSLLREAKHEYNVTIINDAGLEETFIDDKVLVLARHS